MTSSIVNNTTIVNNITIVNNNYHNIINHVSNTTNHNSGNGYINIINHNSGHQNDYGNSNNYHSISSNSITNHNDPNIDMGSNFYPIINDRIIPNINKHMNSYQMKNVYTDYLEHVSDRLSDFMNRYRYHNIIDDRIDGMILKGLMRIRLETRFYIAYRDLEARQIQNQTCNKVSINGTSSGSTIDETSYYGHLAYANNLDHHHRNLVYGYEGLEQCYQDYINGIRSCKDMWSWYDYVQKTVHKYNSYLRTSKHHYSYRSKLGS